MATILECIAVPRVSASLTHSPTRLSSSSVSSISARRRLPEFKGLRTAPTRAFGSVSQNQSSSSRLVRGGRIVCEAQETAVEGQDRNIVNLGYELFSILILEINCI